MQYAVQLARDIWQQRSFGIRRPEWGTITPEMVELTSAQANVMMKSHCMVVQT